MLLLFLATSTLCACSKSEPENPSEEITPQIIFLFSPGGLGDMSYNDCILEGVQKFKRSHPEVDVFLYSPPSMEVADRIFSDWMKRPGSNIPVIFALASSDYEPLLEEYIGKYELTDNKKILLFESLKHYDDSRIHTFQVSMYGASFLSGVTAKECIDDGEALVLLGSSTDVPIESARDGFIEGFGRYCDVEYLAEDWTGFVMPTETYRNMSLWAGKYQFIFPVAGGSNAGIYRYSREFPGPPYLAGMDVDQSGLANQIVGSVVKRFDRLIDEYFTEWLRFGTMPPPQIYGIDSGYVDWVLSPRYTSRFESVVEKARREAIEKEKEYYGLN